MPRSVVLPRLLALAACLGLTAGLRAELAARSPFLAAEHPAPPAASPPPGTTAPPPPSPDPAAERQRREARMLVTDLLDIARRQRRAASPAPAGAAR
jgi:hypothetical protein